MDILKEIISTLTTNLVMAHSQIDKMWLFTNFKSICTF